MPIVDLLVVVDSVETVPPGAARAVADAVAGTLRSPPGRVWVRLQTLPAEHYAENASAASVRPVFVTVLHADPPAPDAMALEAAALAQAIGACLGRGAEIVHVEYAPAGRGRVAFGGRLLR